jgi:predicted unusual protein kinase regulating ubiquinone biosynthesis (AarF/ABC1/UbiB family)
MRLRAGLRRFIHIGRVATKHAIAQALYPHLARWPDFAHKLLGPRLAGPDRLRQAFEEIGGTLIKFGQIMAMQSDLLPLEYCRGLFGLFDRVPAFEYEHVERTFLEDLKKTPQEVFDSFETVPFATGSIGQVHVATLGQAKLAVKIRRPTIIDDFVIDIAFLTFIVKTVKVLKIRKLEWIISPTEEFAAWTQEELDYRREAHYMDELGRNARNNEFEKVPVVFWNCTTARILTVEFLEGVTTSDYLRNMESGSAGVSPDFDPNLFAARLIDNFLGDAFKFGMFHADLHPGNLMILPGNVVGYIDFGISGVLSRYSRRHLTATTLSVARGDIDGLCNSFFLISTFSATADPEGFRQRLKEKAATWYGEEGTSTLNVSITKVMLELLLLSREKGVWPQRDVIKYIRSAVALDGLIRTFSPNVDVGSRLLATSDYMIKWDGLLNLITTESVAGFIGGSTHLFRDGMLRLSAALRGASSDDPAKRSLFARTPEKKHNRWLFECLSLAWIGLCITLLLKPDRHGPGLNEFPVTYLLWSAALSVVAWGAMKITRIV